MAISKIEQNSLASGAVLPAGLSTGAPSWTSGGVLSFNSGYGSVATAYGCRAWVNFNGTGTVAIRASGNVSSITDNGTGNYTINFTTAMPDANYAMAGTAAYSTSTSTNGRVVNTAARGTTSCGVTTSYATNTNEDEEFVQVAFFR